jgi:hypothetical protein
MDVLLKVLIVWVAGATGLPATDNLPELRFDEPAAIGAAVNPTGLSADPITIAYYDASGPFVVLPTGWRPEDPFHLSMLVHELVHHLQQEAGLSYACPGLREREAYGAQQRWLESQGLDLVGNSSFQIDEMFLLLRTSCLF